ncbi:hypothetical protein BDM02DRAFT_3185538 [Thelephora ganbajun]|uniref:Uncharacterized protein n=1 Tax=Thelephora ganbajun TaxID=370292 RepID=A0ACB6ZL82_THEGA|nr:hypothetical protein BDM02DRAFT_3185538 [Thelephora ganbajun]
MAQGGDEDEDYFAHFEDLEFTEEDLARIDHTCEAEFYTPVPGPTPPPPKFKGEASVTIEVEQEVQSAEVVSPSAPSPRSPMPEPPYYAFRSGKSLSVSDLIGPLWCELQYEYRQRQGWGLKVKDRPQTFVSREGNTIVASHSIASNNENILKAGRVVHRRLEREIRPPQVRVDIETPEEYWATRLINMLDCLVDLAKYGFCREMPVFGLTHDHIVSGIIDEISIENVQKPTDGSPITNSRALQRFLHVSDTKTRDTSTIPSERNSTQARTQLMLYHRLLSGLTQPPSDLNLKVHHLDFDVFWLRVGVDPYEPFSDGFCEQTGLSAYDAVSCASDQQSSTADDGDAKQTQFCLNTLVDSWKKTLHLLGTTSVDPTLTLNYRKRETSGRKKRRCTNDGKGRAMSSREEKELDQAIVASLAHVEHEDPALAYAIAESLRDAQATGNPISEQTSPHSTGSSKRDAESDPDESAMNSNNHVEENGRGSELIGSISFVMDDAALDARMGRVLEWWHGIRRPEGVELEDTGRCYTCEFSTSCEWREKKSNELLSKLRS